MFNYQIYQKMLSDYRTHAIITIHKDIIFKKRNGHQKWGEKLKAMAYNGTFTIYKPYPM